MPIISPGIPITARAFASPFWREATLGTSMSDQTMNMMNSSSTYRYAFPFAGKVIGMMWSMSGAISAGTLTINMKKNGTTAASSVITSGQHGSDVYTSPISFAIDDTIEVRWDSDGSLAGPSHFFAMPIITFD